MGHLYNNWINFDKSIDDIFNFKNLNLKKIINLECNLTIDFFNQLDINDSGEKYLINAAETAFLHAGSKPVVMFSGGVDSQTAVLAFKKANIDIDIIFFNFKNDLNIHERETVDQFCELHSVKVNKIDFDVISFLNRENFIYGNKYTCGSPHFNTHLKFVDICRKLGYTGCIFGGSPVLITNSDMAIRIGLNQNWSYIKYAKLNTLPIVDFLLFYPELSWYLFFKQLEISKSLGWPRPGSLEQVGSSGNGYEKIIHYKSLNVELIPQLLKFAGNSSTGYTGFELVKKFYEDIHNNPWYFENQFRQPLSMKYVNGKGPKHILKVDEQTKDYILKMINKYDNS